MALTNSERQAAYRQRIKASGGQTNLNIVVDSDTDASLEALAEKAGISKAFALTVAMAVLAKDDAEARTRSKATGKVYRSSFERTLEEMRTK